MDFVRVYFYANTLYNLEDMSILGTYPKEDEALYEYFKEMKQHYNIVLGIMGLDHPLRNTIYCIFPNATIVIHPLAVSKMINGYLRCTQISNEVEEEIAASLGDESVFGEIGLEYQGIYKSNTKAEAIHHYVQWQKDVPLGAKSFHNVIKTIDYYHEEIFNYFEFKNIFNTILV